MTASIIGGLTLILGATTVFGELQSALDRIWRAPAAPTITRAVGSGLSLLFHVAWFAIWMWLNTPALSGATPFDPFPFPVLTMLVSLEVIFLSVTVLLNQNRTAIEADKRAHLNMQIDLLAERELTLILRMQRELARHLGITSPLSRELEELLKDTDLHEIATKIDRELPGD